MNLKEEHVKVGYFAKITTVKNKRALIVDYPKNIFFNLPELRVVYELEERKLNILRSDSEPESVACPEYALRYLVATDITTTVIDRNMDTCLIKAFNQDGECISSEEDKISLYDLIIPSKNPKTRQLEFIFGNVMNQYCFSENGCHIPDNVFEGFEIVLERHLRGI